MSELRLSSEPDAPEEVSRQISNGLEAFNVTQVGDVPYHPVQIVLRDASEQVQGGLLGGCWGDWLHIAILWIAEPFRGQNWGTRLLAHAEAEAAAHGCRNAYVTTLSFQARPLYERHGYALWAAMHDFPVPGQARYHLKKTLPTA